MTNANAVSPLNVGKAARLTEAAPTIVIPLAKSIRTHPSRMVTSDAIMMINVMIVIGKTAIAVVRIPAMKIVATKTAEIHRGIEMIVMDALPPAIAIMDHLRNTAVVIDSLRYYRYISFSISDFVV